MEVSWFLRFFRRTALAGALFIGASLPAQVSSQTVNDVTGLNPIEVDRVIAPRSIAEIVNAVKDHPGPISIGGGRYSMGGQIATEKTLQIDMRNFDSVLYFSKEKKEITVQTGIRWRKVQEFIDPYDLSIQIMQTYANFTVGGSLSVNVHGRYIGQGPIILSVKQIKMVLADGSVVQASPFENPELFYGAIGGYGGLGVITEATLLLTENCKVKRTDVVMPISDYSKFFFEKVRNDTNVIFHNADIYPKRYRTIREISYTKTGSPVTVKYRLKPLDKKYRFNRFAFKVISGSAFGKWLRQHVIDPVINKGEPVEWRNYEASYDVAELEPKSRKRSTYVLQEYFVPVGQFNEFYPLMTEILRKNKVNMINISIRHAKKDPGSVMAWAREEVFAFVLYYKQGTGSKDKEKVKQWTQQLIDASLSCGGTYYLPYQIHATREQFLKAYPNAMDFFALKKKYDPDNKFRNKLWDAYYTKD